MYNKQMYYVYALYNQQIDRIYVGYTNNLDRRIKEHNKKRKGTYTGRYDGIWVLIFREEIEEMYEAKKREKYYKTSGRRKYLRTLINNPR